MCQHKLQSTTAYTKQGAKITKSPKKRVDISDNECNNNDDIYKNNLPRSDKINKFLVTHRWKLIKICRHKLQSTTAYKMAKLTNINEVTFATSPTYAITPKTIRKLTLLKPMGNVRQQKNGVGNKETTCYNIVRLFVSFCWGLYSTKTTLGCLTMIKMNGAKVLYGFSFIGKSQ